MQEYWPVPVDWLLKVPDTLTDDHAALIEPLAVATHDVTRTGVKTGDAVLVFYLHGSRLYTRGAWEEAIRLGASGAIPLAPVVSRKIPLASLQEGDGDGARRRAVMKALVDVTA
jgi:threonine dehydrogenase-like Zn-dependent dehydrogenase